MLKILLKNRLLALIDQFTGQSRSKKALRAGSYVITLVLCLLLAAGASVGVHALFGGLCANLVAQGNAWAFYALAGGVGFLLSLFLTLFYAQGVIFEAKDNELLLSMPIRPSAILASRMGSVYILNALCVLVMMIAGTYTVAVESKGAFTVLNALLALVSALILPLLSTALSCLLAWAVSFLTRHTRRKVLVQTLISLLAMGLVFFITSNVNQEFFKSLADSAGDIARAFRHTVYPLYAMGMGIAGPDWLMFLAFAAICLVPFALVYFLLSRSFIRIVTARNAAKKQKYEAGTLKGSSVVWAMTKKDLTRFFNSPPYMMNAGLGLLYTVGMAAVSLFSGNELINNILEKGANIANPAGMIALIAAFTLSFLAAMTSISGCSISVESKNLWILKSMPVRAKEVLTGKALSHLVLAIPASVISSILYALSCKELTAAGAALIFLMPIAANTFNALAGVIGNLFYGKMDYPSIAKAAKSAGGALIPILATMLLVGGSAALYLGLLHGKIDMTLYGFIVTGVFFVIDVILYGVLRSPAAQRRWEKLGQ